jgi:hypothetical protein
MSRNRTGLYTQPPYCIGDLSCWYLSHARMAYFFEADHFSGPDLNLSAFARAMKWATSISLGQTKEQAMEV